MSMTLQEAFASRKLWVEAWQLADAELQDHIEAFEEMEEDEWPGPFDPSDSHIVNVMLNLVINMTGLTSEEVKSFRKSQVGYWWDSSVPWDLIENG